MLEWQPNPFEKSDGVEYQLARTPLFNVFRYYEVAKGQSHWMARSRESHFEDAPGFCPHPEIVLITRGRWRFESPNLPEKSHVLTANDGAFSVRAAGGYKVTAEGEGGNGYVCISPLRRDWFNREVVLIPKGQKVTLPARGSQSFLYLGKGSAEVLGQTVDPNEIVELPANETVEIEATEKVAAVTFWRGVWPSKISEVR